MAIKKTREYLDIIIAIEIALALIFVIFMPTIQYLSAFIVIFAVLFALGVKI